MADLRPALDALIEEVGQADDRLGNLIGMLSVPGLPDRLHVTAIREELPTIDRALRDALDKADRARAAAPVADLELRAAETIDSLRTQLAGARAEASLNRAKYEGTLNAIPVIVAKQTEHLAGVARRLREALWSVIANDRTTYEHHQMRPSDGKKPREVGGGTIFLTPAEIALAALETTKEDPRG